MQKYTESFTLRLTPRDVKILAELARVMNRTGSDTLRSLTRREYAAMLARETEHNNQPTQALPGQLNGKTRQAST